MEKIQIKGSSLHVDGCDFVIIAGPCVIESEEMTLQVAEKLRTICQKYTVGYVFKSSFDKANRSSLDSYRGPGLDNGLRILERVRREVGVPVTTDVHETMQVAAIGDVVDIVQIPAFLFRQTDLLLAAARTGKIVNIKKSQTGSVEQLSMAVQKTYREGKNRTIITERGTFFGYGDLVVDFRNLFRMAGLGIPVVFDATHSVQRPSSAGQTTGGESWLAPKLATAAVAAGVDIIFAEVHPEPSKAKSDGPNMIPLNTFEKVLSGWKRIHDARGSIPEN